jgi:hypothetical protein
MVPSAALLARQRRSRPWWRKSKNDLEAARRGPTEEPAKVSNRVTTKEALETCLRNLASQVQDSAELRPYARTIVKLAEVINTGAFIPIDAELSVSTTAQPNVVTAPLPPEKDPILAAILGKEPPPPLNPVNKALVMPQLQQQPAAAPARPSPGSTNVQKAMEAAMEGRELLPKVQLVPSTSLSVAAGILQMESADAGAGGPLLGSPPTGTGGQQVWSAFKRFFRPK